MFDIYYYLKSIRNEESSYIVKATCPRFGSGEAKALINESMRGLDLYIISDCFNYGVTYKMYGMNVPMSPDDHFQDLKRIIAATGGKTRRISVAEALAIQSLPAWFSLPENLCFK